MASDSIPSLTAGYTTSPPNHSHNILITTVTVFAITITILLAVYCLLRHRHIFLRLFSSGGNRTSPETTSSLDSLPLFTFSSVTRRTSAVTTNDCAICLSKFEQRDLLRLLPLCCHAFHAECIDAWLLRSNGTTCPLCRSAVFASESDQLRKVFRSSSSGGSNSFRLEIGNVSNRGAESEITAEETDRRRSYSIGGALEYLVDEEEAEIDASAVASQVSSGRFFTGSSRRNNMFFTGSSRRNDVVGDYDVEANDFGEQISKVFGWLGV